MSSTDSTTKPSNDGSTLGALALISTAVLAVLRLTGCIHWPWQWVTIPLWGYLALALIGHLLARAIVRSIRRKVVALVAGLAVLSSTLTAQAAAPVGVGDTLTTAAQFTACPVGTILRRPGSTLVYVKYAADWWMRSGDDNRFRDVDVATTGLGLQVEMPPSMQPSE